MRLLRTHHLLLAALLLTHAVALAAHRARVLWDLLLEVQPSVHRERVLAFLAGHAAAGRSIYLASPPEIRERLRKLESRPLDLEPVVEVFGTPTAAFLFSPGPSGSRAATREQPMDPPFSIWQIRLLPEVES